MKRYGSIKHFTPLKTFQLELLCLCTSLRWGVTWRRCCHSRAVRFARSLQDQCRYVQRMHKHVRDTISSLLTSKEPKFCRMHAYYGKPSTYRLELRAVNWSHYIRSPSHLTCSNSRSITSMSSNSLTISLKVGRSAGLCAMQRFPRYSRCGKQSGGHCGRRPCDVTMRSRLGHFAASSGSYRHTHDAPARSCRVYGSIT